MSKLTERQAEILQFIKFYIIENGYPPTISEIASAHGIRPNGVQGHLKALIKKGAVSVKKKLSRSIVPTKGFRVRIE